jgi:hypothetical protein
MDSKEVNHEIKVNGNKQIITDLFDMVRNQASSDEKSPVREGDEEVAALVNDNTIYSKSYISTTVVILRNRVASFVRNKRLSMAVVLTATFGFLLIGEF